MANYLLCLHASANYQQTDVAPDAWAKFYGALSSRIEDLGAPIWSRETVGETAADTVLSGYSIITADSLGEAVSLAGGCPLVSVGGGVTVGEITPVDPETLAALSGDQATA